MTRSGLRKVGARWDSQRTGTGISADEHLARSWRRVASTHTLQQLIAPEDAKGGERSLTKKLKGLSMLILALTLLMMHVAHAAALWLPPSALPPFLLLIRKHSCCITCCCRLPPAAATLPYSIHFPWDCDSGLPTLVQPQAF
ncbi:hypothetical protein Vretifemale_11396 [Volvox reticuliferus]|uniref:Uncharacterized protein n=1 Tax=Volvox reticuliferus TaxID=1737510 RepID=A0A8J4CH70_9CHLO|nr:hypothetical protein Vretifemale_11396 [Volvox reticuliferus]